MRLLFPREIFIIIIEVCRKNRFEDVWLPYLQLRLAIFNANHICFNDYDYEGKTNNLIIINLELWEEDKKIIQ